MFAELSFNAVVISASVTWNGRFVKNAVLLLESSDVYCFFGGADIATYNFLLPGKTLSFTDEQAA